jgi:hypothetical protein
MDIFQQTRVMQQEMTFRSCGYLSYDDPFTTFQELRRCRRGSSNTSIVVFPFPPIVAASTTCELFFFFPKYSFIHFRQQLQVIKINAQIIIGIIVHRIGNIHSCFVDPGIVG